VRLILLRHGNTFGPTDTVVYAGSTNDLPLVAHGIEQAHRVADALLAHGIRPQALFSGTLARLSATADIIAQRLGVTSSRRQHDVRLNELDYGQWTGETRDAVAARFGAASIAAWDTAGIWPTAAGWTSTDAAEAAAVADFVQERAAAAKDNDAIVIISSNGRLRYFLRCIPGAYAAHVERRALKVACGNVCVLRVSAGKQLLKLQSPSDVMIWNAVPAQGLGLAQHLVGQ
jgi:broad specificity phosphatase PhoE